MRALCLVVPALLVASAIALDDGVELNPIRKVVLMLNAMQKKVMAEGAREKELYEKFLCHCQTGGGDLETSISSAEVKVPAVASSVKASEEKLVQTKADLQQAQVERTAAKEAVAEAKAMREKEASAFAAEKADMDANIAAVEKAVTAIEHGVAGGFLQTGAAQVLRRMLSDKQEILDGDRQELLAFLSGSQGGAYAPASGEVLGILKELGGTMSKTLAESTAAEESSKKAFVDLTTAKSKEVAALTASIETKMQAVGTLGVKIVQMKEDLSDTEEGLKQDQEYLQNLKKSCATKTAEWEERSKTRSEELVALADTIKALDDDDALELFKKTLPGASASASFVQVSQGAARVRAQAGALEVVRHAHGTANQQDRAGLDLLAVALTGKKVLGKGGFDKVVQMIDKMVSILKQEQKDDDEKLEYCSFQLDHADDKKKAAGRALEQAENEIATASDAIATLKAEIKALEAGIKGLDKAVVEGTEQRRAENVEYKELMAADASAKELLRFAQNRLNKFYNKKLYKPPPTRELSAQDRIVANMGGAALVQVSLHQGEKNGAAVPPPPETWGAYSKKSQESSGVIAMINLLITDLEKEMTEAETEEKNAQADYETMMFESAAKRKADSKALAQKASTLADTEAELESLHQGKASTGHELMAVTRYIASLHAECDWLLQYHSVRKEARAGEMDALTKAKAVLSGADFGGASAALQTRAKGFLGHSA